MLKKSSVFFCVVFVMGLVAAGNARADGMPIEAKKPEPILTPLDKALDEVQNNAAPVVITKPEEKAEEVPAPPVPETRTVEVQPNTSFFGMSVGMYSPFSHRGDSAPAVSVEWQPGIKLGFLQPLIGGFIATNNSMMGYGGVGIPFHLGKKIMMMPSFAAGAYKDGDGFDLGRRLAYRFGTEVSYVFDSQSRLGLNAHMITNGTSLNREDRTEVLGLVYTMPLNATPASKEK